MEKIVYSKEMVEQIGNELLRRRIVNMRDGTPLTHDEIKCMLCGAYAVLYSTASNLTDAFRFLDKYAYELLVV